MGGGILLIKKDLGAAGTVFIRERVEQIVQGISLLDGAKYMDWKWSELFIQRGVRLMSTEESYLQHIGILGQNNHGFVYTFDYGNNFLPISEINQRIMQEFIEELFEEDRRFLEDESKRSFMFDRLGMAYVDYQRGHALSRLPRAIKLWWKKRRKL